VTRRTPLLDLNDKEFLKSLRVLRLITRRFFRDQQMGVRRTHQKGSSLEFSDFREYNPGDDLRFIDWNLYARLDRLFVKLFHDEQNLQVYVLVDASESMNYGSPAKFDYARKVAAAVAYVACHNEDQVRLFSFGEGGLRETSRQAGRGSQVPELFRFLEHLQASGGSELEKAVENFTVRYRKPGVVFVISDFFLDGPHQEALRKLRFGRHEVNLIQLLDEEEIHPNFAGLWKLEDAETGELQEVFVDRGLTEAYQDLVEEWCQTLEGFGKKNGMSYFRTSTGAPFENLLLRFFGAH
jgi:uncharacterized protein (DUF58 family)